MLHSVLLCLCLCVCHECKCLKARTISAAIKTGNNSSSSSSKRNQKKRRNNKQTSNKNGAKYICFVRLYNKYTDLCVCVCGISLGLCMHKTLFMCTKNNNNNLWQLRERERRENNWKAYPAWGGICSSGP